MLATKDEVTNQKINVMILLMNKSSENLSLCRYSLNIYHILYFAIILFYATNYILHI